KVGERVVSNGPHAELICVPKNLCAKIPDNVSDEEAAFTVVGAIGLEGVRLAQPTLGERFVVIGLGLIGLLTVQLLRANGCRVLGVDLDSSKCGLVRQFGAETVDLSRGEDPVEAAMAFSRGRGVDGALITAATKSSEPVHQAAQMCRKRGRIVLVGVTGLELNRGDFYEKELSFQVSCSYGPGRYDPEYEEKGHDYPIGYVRWTEQRNFEAVLDLMAAGKLKVKPLITYRFKFEEAEKAYELIVENKEPYVGIILDYKDNSKREVQGAKRKEKSERIKTPVPRSSSLTPEGPVIGVIGAGNFTGRTLLPALQKTTAKLKAIASSGGVTGTHLGKKFGFEKSTTDTHTIFEDPEINTVFITTRHNTHARFVIEALKAGKNVFVEKPLCLNFEELDEIQAAQSSRLKAQGTVPLLMVGFNRRFAPHVIKMKELLERVREPKSMIMTVNAGIIPPDHWTQDPEVGGGRIIGEACHFIDLLRYLAGAPIVSHARTLMDCKNNDTASLHLQFADGSIGTVHYFANGNRRFPKERLEVFSAGRVLQLDNFKVLRGYGWRGFRRMRLWSQDKGHNNEIRSFIDVVQNGGNPPIPIEEIIEVTRVSIELAHPRQG
ncbi:MAG: Gfo/Idh/MocA family oxidoreductase, partial [Nitrospiraceae bacterium]|nr:Gfo/Idh/MocA family oxidoreductase [Nitrospiraceae bacterium]